MTVANLFARIGIKADTDKAKEFSGAMKGVASDLKVAALGAVAFTAAVVGAMKGALDTAKVYRDFQNESGASTDELQRWQAVAAGANVSTSDLSEAVKGLAQNREKIKLGQGNMSGFAFLGINPMDDPFSILDQLRTKTAGLPQAMKANLLSQMGVSSQFLQILNLTNGEFDRMRSNAFVIPPSAFSAMNAMQGSLNGLGKMFQWFQALLAERLAPIIDKVVKQVTAWVVVNKNGLIDGIVKGTQFVIKFVEAIVNVATWIGRIVNNTIGWKGALAALLVVWGLFNTALLASPITWIIAGIITLILVLDDLHAALGIDGDKRESAFGDVFKKFPELKAIFTGLFDGLQGLLDGLGKIPKIFEALKKGDWLEINKLTEQWGFFGTLVNGTLMMITNLKQLLYDISQGNWSAVLHDLTSNTAGEQIEYQQSLKNIAAAGEAYNKRLAAGGKPTPAKPKPLDPASFLTPEQNARIKASLEAQVKNPVNVTVNNSSAAPIKSDVKTNQTGQTQPAKVEANRGKVH